MHVVHACNVATSLLCTMRACAVVLVARPRPRSIAFAKKIQLGGLFEEEMLEYYY